MVYRRGRSTPQANSCSRSWTSVGLCWVREVFCHRPLPDLVLANRRVLSMGTCSRALCQAASKPPEPKEDLRVQPVPELTSRARSHRVGRGLKCEGMCNSDFAGRLSALFEPTGAASTHCDSCLETGFQKRLMNSCPRVTVQNHSYQRLCCRLFGATRHRSTKSCRLGLE